MPEIWRTATEQFDKGQDFALATLLSLQGSCPGDVGARLIVLNGGTVVGTVGGGLFEVQVQDLALKGIETKTSHRALFSFCGGETESAETVEASVHGGLKSDSGRNW